MNIGLQHHDETFRVNRFGQVASGAEGRTRVRIVHNGEDDDGDRRQYGISSQGSQDRPAVHIWHLEIKGDGCRAQYLGQPQACSSTGRGDDMQPFLGQKSHDEVEGSWVVVDYQDDFLIV
jgi:hypothetical protein